MKSEVLLMPLFSGGAPDSWQARNKTLFPSNDSLRYFLRTHRRELVSQGAVVFHRGAYQATERMTPVVLSIAQRAAQRVVEGEAA